MQALGAHETGPTLGDQIMESHVNIAVLFISAGKDCCEFML